ncbi:MAG: SDR family oxidoreductase [Gammaproteobacteria bacterium]|nr:SDR family oxidoreductase [Gammaproteobacteria bacterium]MBK8308062.1 SDR family oxidoreductase [Gammaproteobacteria bacterium]MBK9664459.1 SDR family oxidoreductase [Gammaproteobacteria bacterium]
MPSAKAQASSGRLVTGCAIRDPNEVGGDGITANAIVLGLIGTVPEECSSDAERYFSTGRIDTPSDIGAAAIYLASPEASWVTG